MASRLSFLRGSFPLFILVIPFTMRFAEESFPSVTFMVRIERWAKRYASAKSSLLTRLTAGSSVSASERLLACALADRAGIFPKVGECRRESIPPPSLSGKQEHYGGGMLSRRHPPTLGNIPALSASAQASNLSD